MEVVVGGTAQRGRLGGTNEPQARGRKTRHERRSSARGGEGDALREHCERPTKTRKRVRALLRSAASLIPALLSSGWNQCESLCLSLSLECAEQSVEVVTLRVTDQGGHKSQPTIQSQEKRTSTGDSSDHGSSASGVAVTVP